MLQGTQVTHLPQVALRSRPRGEKLRLQPPSELNAVRLIDYQQSVLWFASANTARLLRLGKSVFQARRGLPVAGVTLQGVRLPY